jgi:SAM-dependent methyltransferase
MSSVSVQEQCYPEIRFGGFSRVDGTVAFFTRVQALVRGASFVADVGCGRGVRSEDTSAFRRQLADLRGSGRRVVGLDVSQSAAGNPMIDSFRLIEPNAAWPLDDNSVDLLLSDYVLEHLEQPGSFFAEISRVLKAGGYFCARTPNRWGYVALASRLLHSTRHARVVTKVQQSRKEEDVFETFYRCNTAGKLNRLLRKAGMTGVVIPFESEPNYLAFNPLLYRSAAVLHRFLPDTVKANLFVFARKPPR